MAISIGDFKYAGSYANGFDAAKPITPGADLSSAYTDALGSDSQTNFQLGAESATAGLEGIAKRRQAKELAQSYLDQAKSVREFGDAQRAAQEAANRKKTGSDIGRLFGTVVGGIFGGPFGASVGAAAGGGIGSLV